jgi:enoyl-CoA hydratase/carnithine racemase
MADIDVRLEGHVAIATLNAGENRFNPDFLSSFLKTLDKIEHDTDARNLIVISAHEKIFSNGIDLEWLAPEIQAGNLAAAKDFFFTLNRLFQKLLTYPLITIVAINGHAFAGGAILCCAFDFRFMQTGRGFFCFPEVDLGIPFLPGMNALLLKAIPRYMVEEMQYSGRRLTAEECARHHIIREAFPPEDLLAGALDFARAQKKQRAVLGEMKTRLNAHIINTMLEADKPLIESGRYHIG